MDSPQDITLVKDRFIISDILARESTGEQVSAIFSELNAPQKRISSRYFYDEYGSFLFEKITATPEYYLTRTEKSILENIAPILCSDAKFTDIIEPGSGDCSKISILLDAIPEKILSHIRYIPVDVSMPAIIKSAEFLTSIYPQLEVHGIVADFMKHFGSIPEGSKRLICFFGSTIGNLEKAQATGFLQEIEKFMEPEDHFLLGLDTVKEKSVLEAAYNDSKGITALFNMNILKVMNDYAHTNFKAREFEHIAFYNEDKARIEMHLRARKDVIVESEYFPKPVFLMKGETIHTENSHKYTDDDIQNFSVVTGLKIEDVYTDDKRWFSVVSFRKT
ncbi:MAG TPA: L-histidine N(alpha)-methyltransferase [Bacteroidales bacterium]|nr:L-histidine N(alpha)-methyltransferase [Bacteroidales bacterium]